MQHYLDKVYAGAPRMAQDYIQKDHKAIHLTPSCYILSFLHFLYGFSLCNTFSTIRYNKDVLLLLLILLMCNLVCSVSAGRNIMKFAVGLCDIYRFFFYLVFFSVPLDHYQNVITLTLHITQALALFQNDPR